MSGYVRRRSRDRSELAGRANRRPRSLHNVRPARRRLHLEPLEQRVLLDAAAFTDINAAITGLSFGSAAWGDYDNDGRLDLAVTGSSFTTDFELAAKVYHNNADGTFTDSGAALTPVHHSAVAWVDYDNDGDLDVTLAGYDGTAAVSKIYRNDGAGSFTAIDAGLVDVYSPSLAWGDYDNDGDPDLALAGLSAEGPTTRIYRNDGGTLTDTAAAIVGVDQSTLAWGDYDNDGDLDLAVTGTTVGFKGIARIYRNDQGVFNDLGAGLPNVAWGSVAWGDYDSDGDLDLALTGYTTGGQVGKVYRNDGGTFADSGTAIVGVNQSSLAWGDYDNDGDPDLAVSGWVGPSNVVSRVYRNDGGTLADSGAELAGVYRGSISWGDYNGDGKLDLAILGDSGVSIAKIYHNAGTTANTPPTAPGGLAAAVAGRQITFTWAASADTQTPAKGLSYNLRVGTTAGDDNIFAAAADLASGLRRIPATGNVQQRLSWTVKNLPVGTYYWSVQAVDAGLAGSPWAAEQVVAITDVESPVAALDVSDITVAGGATHTFTVTYSDNYGIDVSDLDGSDLRVTGPNGFDQLAVLVSVNDETDGTPRVATYSIAATGDAWDVVDKGTYTVSTEANQVHDINGNVLPEQLLGTFRVEVDVDLTRPTAALAVENIVNPGGANQTLTVTYADNLAVDVSDLDDSDLRVTGPNGFDQLATFVSVDDPADGTPRVATYSITAPGGTWDGTDNGEYTVLIESNQVSDTSENFVPAGTLGTFQVDLDVTRPTATFMTSTVLTAGGTIQTLAVTYVDDRGLDVSDLDNGDVRVTGPNGFDQLATFVSVDDPADGTPRVATYTIPAAGGTWDGGDNGTYTVAIESEQVRDTSGNTLLGGTLGTFQVDINVTPPTAALAASPLTTSANAYTLTVTYSDNRGVDVSDLDNNDLRITGLNGYSQLATLVSVDKTGDGTPRIATYQVTPPGGAWDTSDNGTYAVSIEPNQVSDASENVLAGRPLGTFQVALERWSVQSVDRLGDVGSASSLVLDKNGVPNISYFDSSNGDLKYATWKGTSWGIETVDSQGIVGQYSSIALDPTGKPQISYYNTYSSGTLWCASWTGGTVWNRQTIAGNYLGQGNSFEVDRAGNAGVSYCHAGQGDLFYASRTGPSSWRVWTPVDTVGNVGLGSSLELDSAGNPRISYLDATNNLLKYAAWNATTNRWDIQTVGGVGWVSESSTTSLKLDSAGRPHIGYVDAAAGLVKYAVLDGPNWNVQVVDSRSMGRYASLALDNGGSPHLSYFDAVDGDLKYAYFDGVKWNAQTADGTGIVGMGTSLALDTYGRPRISYYDFTNGDLKYAVANWGGSGEIRGTRFNDANGNGVQDGEDLGLPNKTVYLDMNQNGSLDVGEQTAQTDAAGNYVLAGLIPGQYRVAEVLDEGWEQTQPVTGATGGTSGLFALRTVNSAGTIYELAPATGSVLRSFAAPAPIMSLGWQGLALGPGSVFYIDGSSGNAHTLWELDPSTGSVTDSDIVDAAKPASVDGLAYLDGKVYLTQPTYRQFLVWDPTTDTLVKTMPWPASVTLTGGLTGAADLGLLFAASTTGTIVAIDPVTGTIARTLNPGVGTLSGGMAYTNAELIAGTFGTPTSLYRINPVSGAVLGTLPFPGTGTFSALGGDGAFSRGVPSYSITLGAGQKAFGVDFGNHELDLTAPRVLAVVVEGGAAQRSDVRNFDVAFSEDVTLAPDAVSLTDKTGNPIALDPAAISYDPATWTLAIRRSESLPDGDFQLRLSGAGIEDAAGNAMADNSIFPFFRLQGDTDGNRAVDVFDVAKFQTSFGQPSGMTPGDGDLDRDGDVDVFDVAVLQTQFGKSLALEPPAGMPAAEGTVASMAIQGEAASRTAPAARARGAAALEAGAELRPARRRMAQRVAHGPSELSRRVVAHGDWQAAVDRIMELEDMSLARRPAVR
ncbi:MAG: FG-GAP-like repeat-containing protein [Pirellulales bacterium]